MMLMPRYYVTFRLEDALKKQHRTEQMDENDSRRTRKRSRIYFSTELACSFLETV